MAQLSTKIKLYAKENGVENIDFTSHVILQDDSNGQGTYIKEWNLDIIKPTDAQLNSYETDGNENEALKVILNKRASEYPTWKDQLDMQYKDLLNGTTTWKDAVAKVKADNPKD